MWKEKLLTLLSSLSKTQIVSIGLFSLGLVLLSGGLIYSLRSSNSGQAQEITFESANSAAESQTEQKISVDVEGAVILPGVYTLSLNSRVKDALIAAGGLSSDADREWIAKNLNLALKLSDSSKIYIPKIGETIVQASNTDVSSSGLVNINSASSSELDSLPGVGPVTAQKIIDNRPYSSIEDLKNKKIVGSSVFEKIKDKIVIY